METIIEIKSIFGKVLFSYKKEDNSVKQAVEAFLKDNYDKIIREVDFSDLDLSNISFDNSRFYNSRFDNSRFDNSRFDNSSFYNSRFYNSSFYNSSFYNSSFDNSIFDNSSFNDIPFIRLKFINGLYNYSVACILGKNGTKYIKMGCYLRTLAEWENDFWNNNNEFPNDDSEKSNMRKFAFECAKKWFETIELSAK